MLCNVVVRIVTRSLSKALELVSSDNALYTSFYRQVHSGNRRAAPSVVDRERLLVDDLLFPHYKRANRIRCAFAQSVRRRELRFMFYYAPG